MKRVSGSVEMALRLSLDVPDPIAYLVARTPALKAARDRTFRARHKPSYDDKIRFGQQFDQALTQLSRGPHRSGAGDNWRLMFGKHRASDS